METKLSLKLKEFINNAGMKQKHFAEKIGRNQNSLSRILKGFPVTLETAFRINKETNNFVTMTDAGFPEHEKK